MMHALFKALGNGYARLWRMHWLSVLLMLGLSATGVAMIYSATHTSEQPFLRIAAEQQIVWMGVGFIGFCIMAMIDYHFWARHGFWLLGLAVILLIVTLIVAKPVNGAKSWLIFGPLRVQPAELTKLAYICALTHLLYLLRKRIHTVWAFLAACGLAIIPFGLIMKQPDLGSGLVFGPITLFALFVAGARKRYVLFPVLAIAIIFAASYLWVHKMGKPVPYLKEYQNNRIRTFFDPSRDPRGAGWTINQSLIAIGSGGLQGKGYIKGDQNVYGFLPKNIAYNDFIFAIVGEELGFIGGGALILVEALLMFCMIQIAFRAADTAGAVIAAGILGLFFTHFFVNIGMTIQVVPITGIPLPFISYGGTFIVVCMAAMGLLQSIWASRHTRISQLNPTTAS